MMDMQCQGKIIPHFLLSGIFFVFSPWNTPHLTRHYTHKRKVLNDQCVCLGGSPRGEESQTVDFFIGVPVLTILARLHLF